MSRDGSGTYTMPANSFNPAVDGTVLNSSDWNTTKADIETAITQSDSKDGQTRRTGGVLFPSTPVPSSDVNMLDDYKEGSATPTIAFGGSSTGITYSTQTYEYTVIGNRVLFFLNITLSNKGSATGSATIVVTHPHTPVSGQQFMARTALIDLDQASGYLGAYCSTSGTGFAIRTHGDNVATAALTDAAFQNTSQITVSGHFRF